MQDTSVKPVVTGTPLSHRLWLEGPEFINRWNRYLKFSFLTVGVYALGALSALFGGILSAYIFSPAFLMGSAGVAWVVTSVPARTRDIDLLYSKVLSAFGGSQTAARDVHKAFERLCDVRWHLLVSAVIMLALSGALFCAFFLYPFKIFDADITSLRPVWFSSEIYSTSGGWPGFVTVGLFALLISVSMGTSLWLMFGEQRILSYLCNLPVPPLPEALRVKLRPIADFHVRVARDWSIGALLFVLLFISNADVFSLTLVALITVIAGYVFITPQVRLRKIVMKAHSRAVETVIDAWYQGVPAQHDVARDPSFLADLATISTPPGYWVYGSGQVLMWTVAEATAIGAVILQVAQSASPH